MKKIHFFSAIFTICIIAASQIIIAQTNTFPSTGAAGIGTVSPNASSLLEIKSTSKGILIPRMTQAQKNAIVSPVEGLLIYQTNGANGFYYYDGGSWKAVSPKNANQYLSNLTAPTAVNADIIPDSNSIRNLGSGRLSWKNIYIDTIYFGDGSSQSTVLWKKKGSVAYYNTGNVGIGTNTPSAKLQVVGGDAIINGINVGIGTGSNSYGTAVGNSALSSNTSGYFNTAFGASSLKANTTGYQNTAIGEVALETNTTGNENTAVGSQALLLTAGGSYNTAVGSRSGFLGDGSYNTFIGQTSGYSNNGGNANTFVGQAAGYSNTTASNNTATGYEALYSNTTGSDNTANGYQALITNSMGSENVALGTQALGSNTDNDNTAVGYQSLASNTSGSSNTATGWGTLNHNTTGYGNTAYGLNALPQNTSGFYNTTVGEFSLYTSLGNGNTAIGYGADVSSGQINNATALGLQAIATASNSVMVGGSFVSSIGGYANWTNFSDGRYKQNIKQNVPGLEFINKLNPITYTLNVNAIETKLHSNQKEMKSSDGKLIPAPTIDPVVKEAINEKSKIVYTGFIAQEVEQAAKSIGYNFSGVDKPEDAQQSFYGLRYSDFVVPLVKAVQELSKLNDAKDSAINNLQSQINELKAMIISNQSTVNGQQSTVLSSASLQQNIPNPFTNTTTIGYSLPQKFSSAQIVITDKLGNTLRAINISGSGKGSLNVDASTLSSGAYQYSLIVDEKLMATKQMILTR